MCQRIIFIFLLLCVIIFASSCSSHKSVAVQENNDFQNQVLNNQLYNEVESWLGTPYKYGGQSRSGIDCSGLIVEIYKSVYNKKLYRTSNDIYNKNCQSIEKEQLREGDLVFFNTTKNSKYINHVGLYLNNNKFVHSSTLKGVIISDLSEKYYMQHFLCAGRVIVY